MRTEDAGEFSPVWIALGSNLGDRAGILRQALDRMQEAGYPLLDVSHLYETRPEEDRDEPPYLNAVLRSESASSPHTILQTLLEIEADLGRTRSEKVGSRTCDLDLLAVGDIVIEGEDLILPHPRMNSRAFVLVPLCEIDSGWVLPGTEKTAAQLLGTLPHIRGEVRVHEKVLTLVGSADV